MRFLQIAFRRQTAAPMLALIFASAVSVMLVTARIAWTSNIRYAFLIRNLFLAWLPLVFALFADDRFRAEARAGWRFLGFGGAWLLFFPNAPYIFTDLIHLTSRFYGHFWVDMVLILMCALTGLVLGFVSLYLMQSVVAQMFGRLASWLFILAATVLGSLGIYLGRFLRFNSWDVFVKPTKVYQEIGAWTDGVGSSPPSVAFLLLFAAFLLIAYLMLYALTHLSPAQAGALPSRAGELADA
jgi:uncharacterized membrane protein